MSGDEDRRAAAVPSHLRRHLSTELEESTGEVISSAVHALENAVPEMVADEHTTRLFADVVAQATVEHAAALLLGAPVRTVEPPEPNLKLARDLVARGVPASSLMRATELSRAVTLQHIIAAAREVPEKFAPGVVSALAREVDEAGIEIGVGLVRNYESSLAVTGDRGPAEVSRLVAELLIAAPGGGRDVAATLGYPLDQFHQCLVVRDQSPLPAEVFAEVEQVLHRLPGVTRVLMVPNDPTSSLFWLSAPDPVSLEAWRIELLAGTRPSTRVAAASGGPALRGFQEAHRLATAVASLVERKKEPRVVCDHDVSPLLFLADDRTRATRWAATVLGDLTPRSERAQVLLDTLRVWYLCGQDTSTSGSEMYVHPNTVKYRVRQATDLLPTGRAIGDLEVRLAVEYWHWVNPDPSVLKLH